MLFPSFPKRAAFHIREAFLVSEFMYSLESQDSSFSWRGESHHHLHARCKELMGLGVPNLYYTMSTTFDELLK